MRLTSFQRLAIWTLATTYFLILVGGLVRASGAGLGCPDWPRCFGSWIPPASAANLPPQFDPSQFNPTLMWTEYLNRILGVTVGFLILATAVSAWRHHRRDPHILWTTIAAFLLVGFEGWLGGRVVAHELAAWIVTAHLIVAIIIVQLLLYATYASSAQGPPSRPDALRAEADAQGAVTWAVGGLIALTLLQAGFGTQVRGAVDAALDSGVARELAISTVGWLDLIHRDLAFVLLIGSTLLTLWLMSKRSPLVNWSLIVLALAGLQIAVGIYMAYGYLLPAAQVAHLTLSSLLLGAETVLWLMSRSR
ncbi:MAG TPA: COX15/CtaA family protein [Vicinamibacterales bacterium]|nr:COX15/CtaA family protein [Vicinamibacterales bacterium]